MGVLTTPCLLHDEVLLFGSKPLEEHLQDQWEQHESTAGAPQTVAERMLEVLLPEKVVSFYSPNDVGVIADPGSTMWGYGVKLGLLKVVHGQIRISRWLFDWFQAEPCVYWFKVVVFETK